MDLMYFASCSFLVFSFILVTNSGKVRLYTAVGILFGWLIYYFSFGTIAIRLSRAITTFVRGVFLSRFLRVKSLFCKLSKKTDRLGAKCKKNARKTDKKVKFNLQKYRHIVYNLYGYIINRNNSEKEKKNGC